MCSRASARTTGLVPLVWSVYLACSFCGCSLITSFAGFGGGAGEGQDLSDSHDSGEPSIQCALNAAPCAAPSEECCLTSSNTLTCASTSLSDPCPQGTDIKCDDPSDCAVGVCCISLDMGSDILGTSCESSCGNGEVELCSPGGTCDAGSCVALNVQPDPPIHNPWFYACQ